MCRRRLELALVLPHSLFSEPEMKQRTRDNLIYLAIGLTTAAFVLVDFFYADSHGRKMWWPSRFASRGAYTVVLLAYFVARETRKVKATLVQVVACVLFASTVHLALIFALRQVIGQLSVIPFSALMSLEIFLVVELQLRIVRYLKSG
jgi:hypothetical protein